MEKTREAILERRLDALRREVLASGYESLICNDFQKALPLLRDTSLHGLFRQMPKAWLCHAHFEASFCLEQSLDFAFESEDVYISPARGEFGWKIAYRQAFEACQAPEGWRKLKDAAEEQPGLRAELKRSLTTSLEDLSPRIWPRFEEIFLTLANLNCYKPHFVKLYTKAFEDMAAEGILGVDFRFICQPVFDETGRRLSPEETFSLYLELEEAVRKKYPWFKVRFVYCSHKGLDLDTISREIAFAEKLAEHFPGRISGFDLVSCEDCGRDLTYYAPALKKSKVPVIMHAGETLDPANRNVEYALDLGIRRIGHALNLHRHPEVLEKARKLGTVIESSPLSNQLLGYTPDLRLHPAKDYIAKGLKVTLNSDDCGLFGSSYLADDLLLAYLCWGLSLEELKQCLVNSLAAAPEGYSGHFHKMWDEFVERNSSLN